MFTNSIVYLSYRRTWRHILQVVFNVRSISNNGRTRFTLLRQIRWTYFSYYFQLWTCKSLWECVAQSWMKFQGWLRQLWYTRKAIINNTLNSIPMQNRKLLYLLRHFVSNSKKGATLFDFLTQFNILFPWKKVYFDSLNFWYLHVRTCTCVYTYMYTYVHYCLHATKFVHVR